MCVGSTVPDGVGQRRGQGPALMDEGEEAGLEQVRGSRAWDQHHVSIPGLSNGPQGGIRVNYTGSLPQP